MSHQDVLARANELLWARGASKHVERHQERQTAAGTGLAYEEFSHHRATPLLVSGYFPGPHLQSPPAAPL